MIQETIQSLVVRRHLSINEAHEAMKEIMDGKATPAQIGAFVTALHLKGETIEEISGMAQAMRESSLHVNTDGVVVDTCGTGGDSSGTFNISTTVGLVAAGAGIKVAKHGNRAMTGNCGSADVLEALDVKIDLSPNGVETCLNEIGFGFMFAQTFHPSMRFAAGPRKEIGIRTVFNILGPLTNPAGAKNHLLGVSKPDIGEKIAHVLNKLGSTRALIVHGMDGLDEITMCDSTQVWDMQNQAVTTYTVSPEFFGFNRATSDSLKSTGVKDSVKTLLNILSGKTGPSRDVVLMNTAATLVAANKTETLKEGVSLAKESIDSGKAMGKLKSLIKLSQNLK